MDTELLILSHATHNPDYHGQVITHIEPKFFEDKVHGTLFGCMMDYFVKTAKIATKEAVEIAFAETNMNDKQFQEGLHILGSLQPDPNTDTPWLVETTEKWAKSRKQYHALSDGLQIHNGKMSGLASDLMKDAENFSFKARDYSDHFMTFGKRVKKKNPIIAGIMSPGDVSLFVGQPGSYKSFISFLMAYCTSTGRDFEGHKC